LTLGCIVLLGHVGKPLAKDFGMNVVLPVERIPCSTILTPSITRSNVSLIGLCSSA